MNLKERFNLPFQFWIIALIAFINSVSFTIIIPLLYPYAKQFDLSDFAASLLTTAFAISQFIATPILGSLSDRWGRKPLLVASLLGTVIANLLAAFTPFAWLLYAARILDGITGGNISIARAVISDISTNETRAKAFGLFEAAFRLGFVAGPSISYFAQQLPPLPGISPLGMSFGVAASIAFLGMLLSGLVLPETRQENELRPLRWQDFGIARILRSPTNTKYNKLYLLTFFNGFTFTIFTFAFQPFILYILNQDAEIVALLFVVVGITGFLAQLLLLEPLAARFSLVTILAVSIIGRGILFLVMPTFPNLTTFVVLTALLGVANSFPLALTNTILSLRSSRGEQGEVLGINASYLSISNAFGPAVSGLLVSLSYKLPFWITGVLTLFTAWFAWSLQSDPNGNRS